MTQTDNFKLQERNAQIVERYNSLTAAQPLATPNKVINYLAGEYNLTPQQIGRIVREAGVPTNGKEVRS